MQKIKQLRYRAQADGEVYEDISLIFNDINVLNNGTTSYPNVKQIGIQGLPGTHFWLNDSWASAKEDTSKGLYLNWTGIFELDLSEVENGNITSLRFATENQVMYNDNPSTALVIDILYDINI